ncbi:hypothetical protein [Spirosoma luteum]|uniref:hypothetical protein n=1 Tax=Spirosoma luteum TaxID=431553 RepID=UPI000376C115|nr:hypothetical protein [Spirosoma luteum]
MTEFRSFSPTDHSVSPATTDVAKLLLNAWSAEFALRIKPISTDRHYLIGSLSWVYPQAYFSVLFSVRAVLAVDGIRIANPARIETQLTKWVQQGLYGVDEALNELVHLMQHGPHRLAGISPLSGPEAAALHVQLTQQLNTVSLIHESYLHSRMGASTYQQLIDGLPAYLREGAPAARATLLQNPD